MVLTPHGIHMEHSPLVERYANSRFRIPLAITSRVQRILNREWITHIPVLQQRSPASLAALILYQLLETSSAAYQSGIDCPTVVVDFCSGAGGPVPYIARELNSLLAAKGSSQAQFMLTDLRPNVFSWRIALEESTGFVDFIEDPVDATLPLYDRLNHLVFFKDDFGSYQRKGRLFGLYCLAFHHFSDDVAKSVLQRAMETFDGFAILELQDRRLSSFILMGFHFFFVLIFSVVWFWSDPIHLLFTYAIPVLPTIMFFDGCVSALRTREFREIMTIIDEILGTKIGHSECEPDKDDNVHRVQRGDWIFQGGRQRHTSPFGYINWVTGYRVSASAS
jgi:hypothetical protein